MKILFLIFILSISSHATDIPKFKTITVCAEDTGWPPFSIPPGVHKNDSDKFKGYNLDIISYIFTKHKIDFEIVIKPWKRCLHEGKSGEVNIVLDAAANSERRENYLLTNPIYMLTPIYFYSNKKSHEFKRPLSPDELTRKNVVCGQVGYTYNNFGFKNTDVKMFSKDLENIFDLVMKERCTIGLARKEVFLTELKNFNHAKKIGHQEIIGVNKEEFFWLINKKFSYAETLKEIIDSEIKILNDSGKANEIIMKYY